jgi:Amt family ammonium transporter
MTINTKAAHISLIVFGLLILSTAPTLAAVTEETAYILNTFSFLVHGVLVMLMAAGFAMLESGLVRSKNTAAICLKNIGLYSIAGLSFYIIGYNLMYSNVGNYFGSFMLFYNPSSAEIELLNSLAPTEEMVSDVTVNKYAVGSDWFFQMVFVATAASIVSGTLAERIKVWPFMAFVIILSSIIYPVQASWTWGGGFLDKLGFSDFAGSTLVHSCGGWAALIGAIILGPRKGRFGTSGSKPIPGANLPLATLGTFLLWFGWFGFNGGSQLALGSASDATAIAIVYVNTNLAACGGVFTAMLLTQILYGKIDLTMCLNGALAGLVAITAGPTLQNHGLSILVGSIGSVLAILTVPILERFKIDDVVGAIPVHLVAGVWGTLAVGIFGEGNFSVQFLGILATGVFVSITSAIVWTALDKSIGIRVSEENEELGMDKAELGLQAYPEFHKST